jgi:hypothetical protein
VIGTRRERVISVPDRTPEFAQRLVDQDPWLAFEDARYLIDQEVKTASKVRSPQEASACPGVPT